MECSVLPVASSEEISLQKIQCFEIPFSSEWVVLTPIQIAWELSSTRSTGKEDRSLQRCVRRRKTLKNTNQVDPGSKKSRTNRNKQSTVSLLKGTFLWFLILLIHRNALGWYSLLFATFFISDLEIKWWSKGCSYNDDHQSSAIHLLCAVILELYQGITDNKLTFLFQLTKVQIIFLYCVTPLSRNGDKIVVKQGKWSKEWRVLNQYISFFLCAHHHRHVLFPGSVSAELKGF